MRAYYEVLHWQHCRQYGAYVKIDNDCMHDYNITFYCELAAKSWMKTITQIQTHRVMRVGLLFATTSRATIRQDASASDVGLLDFYTDANTCISEA